VSDVARYVPLDGRGFRLAMGLRPLEPANWLEFGADAERQLAERSRLLAERRDDVVALCDGSLAACEELAAAVVANLAEYHPARARRPEATEHPLIAASALVCEDLCVMARDDGAWRLVAAVVCFPSRWRLADKIGTTLEAIHDPVPGYGEQLGAPSAALFDRLGVERGYWRLNWTLLDDPALFQPGARRAAPAADPAAWQFRVERQTLRRLAVSGAVVFTIRTYVSAAAELAAAHEGFVDDVARVLESAPAATLAYKGWLELAPRWRAAFAQG
jgi:hypothetical protein